MKSNLLFKLMLLAGTPIVLWASREPVAAMWKWFSDRDAVAASMEALREVQCPRPN